MEENDSGCLEDNVDDEGIKIVIMSDERKKRIENYLIDSNMIDLAIFDAYKEMPKEFQKSLSFESYFAIHRKNIEDNDFFQSGDEGNVDPDNEDNKEEEIPKEKRCIICKENIKCDDWYCFDCRTKKKNEAEKREYEIKEELENDSNFLKYSTLDGAIGYVKKKYRNDRENNKLLPLKQIAKETYQFKKDEKKTKNKQITEYK